MLEKQLKKVRQFIIQVGGKIKIKVMSFFPKKGWIYIIINSLAPGVFKMGCSTSPIIDNNGKLIGRCRGYYSHFPVGKWKLVFSKEVDDISHIEKQLINYFSNECKFKNIDESREWFTGDWKKINLFNNFDIRLEKISKKKTKALNSDNRIRCEKTKLANYLIKLGIKDENIRYRIYCSLNINSISDLFKYENKFGSIKHYAIQEKKHINQIEKLREILSRMYTKHSVGMILSKVNKSKLNELLSMNERELLRTLM